LRTVRTALARPDSITSSAANARDEIGRAVAAKIAELQNANDLARVVEEVLPEIEKFLESPEERRLRRMRAGVTLAAIGTGVTLFLLLLEGFVHEQMPWAVGLILLFLGLGILVNGAMFSLPRKSIAEPPALNPVSPTGEIQPQPTTPGNPPSVTENTTKQLKEF